MLLAVAYSVCLLIEYSNHFVAHNKANDEQHNEVQVKSELEFL